MERIAVFDFCGTIANFQTFDPFMKFIIQKCFPVRYHIIGNKWFQSTFQVIAGILNRLGFHGSIYKRILVRQLKGMSEEEIRQYGKDYYEAVVRRNLILETLTLLKESQRAGYRIMIVSGGSELYIRYFADEFGIEDVITSKLRFANGVCCGDLNVDCMGSYKVSAIKRYMEEHKIQGILDMGVTDSASDRPILEICRRKVVISNIRHQDWVGKDMEEIIWE